MPLCSTSSTIFTMPTRLQDAENRRKEEEAMAATTLQWEKEATARRRKGDTAKTTAVKRSQPTSNLLCAKSPKPPP